MDKVVYLGMTGAKQNLIAQTVMANNLANVNTIGFKEDLASFTDKPVHGTGKSDRIFSEAKGVGVNFHSGPMISTGRDLDVAIQGDGWIAVLDRNNQEAYTRAGNLNLTQTGQLETGAGLRVLGQGGALNIPPADKIDIGTDGTITIIPQGGDPKALVELDRIKLVKPDSKKLEKGEDGLFHLKDPAGKSLPDSSVKLVTDVLEGSNVNAVSQLVNMISIARSFEVNLKVLENAQQNDAQSAQIMQIRA